MRPDFILKPLAGATYDGQIVELKLPTQRVIKATPRREGLYAPIYEAVQQLRAYGRYFEEDGRRKRLAESLGWAPHSPQLDFRR